MRATVSAAKKCELTVAAANQATHLLLVEDSTQLAGAVARELEGDFGYRVDLARDASEARQAMVMGARPAVIVTDLLFEHVNRHFTIQQQQSPAVSTARNFVESGLATIATAREFHPQVATVIWTSGEDNRRLHLLFAEQEMGVLSFCSKSSATGRSDDLVKAIQAALHARAYSDPVLCPYLSPPKTARFAPRLIGEDAKRCIWRALARGANCRQAVAALTNYSDRTIGNKIPEMYEDLQAIDPGLPPGGKPFIEVARFAATNWQFFLDETVHRMYP